VFKRVIAACLREDAYTADRTRLFKPCAPASVSKFARYQRHLTVRYVPPSKFIARDGPQHFAAHDHFGAIIPMTARSSDDEENSRIFRCVKQADRCSGRYVNNTSLLFDITYFA
jgi:hypothetical protein